MKIAVDKSLATNALAVAVIISGYASPVYSETLKSIGYFALSGAITNWLAIHMLFEKVPFLYGSGVIPNRFEEFKVSIKDLMMAQFFTEKHVVRFIEQEGQSGKGFLNLDPLLNAVDYDRIFDILVASLRESSFGGMVDMFGGAQALEPLRERFCDKLRKVLTDMVETDAFKAALRHGLNARRLGEDVVRNIEAVIDKRLSELTPQLVKEIVQHIIREHLGWLVVWGGVFGGLIGLLVSWL
ncbi:MAG: DUF445 domain-containing protein [Pseudomonadota bacterium]